MSRRNLIMITAKSVKELREMTGAGMMDCKKALVETEGNMEKAIEFLREKGLAAAAKKKLVELLLKVSLRLSFQLTRKLLLW